MIVDASITVMPFAPKGASTYVVVESEGRGEKNQSKKSKSKKRDSIRSRHSRKMAQEIR
ncbi:MAG: hypothetical protein ACMUEL_05645 [Flavobacteriales bacterium Tduv]